MQSSDAPRESVRRMAILGLRTAVALLCIGHVASDAAEQLADETVERVVAAWKFRNEQIRSARVEWTQTVTEAKGQLLNPNTPKEINPDSLFVPSRDLTYEAHGVVSFLNGLLKYELIGPRLEEEGELRHYHSVEAFNGTATKNLFFKSDDSKFPSGFIESAKDASGVAIVPILPALWAFARAPVNVERLVSRGPTGNESDRSFLLLEEQARAGSERSRTIQVDATRGHLPGRIQSLRSGTLTMQFDIEYTPDPKYGWVPSGWRYSKVRPDGSLTRSILGAVTSLQINLHMTKAEFDIEFPPNSVVTDTSQGKVVSYIQRPNGDKRVITPAEESASYERWLATESGMAAERRGESGTRILIVLSGAAIVLLVVYLMRQSRR